MKARRFLPLGIAAILLLAAFAPAIADGLGREPTAPVAQGGTGDTTLGAHAVLVGQGASPVATVDPATSGYCLMGNTGAAPTYQVCPGAGTGGSQNTFSYVQPTPGANATLTAVNTPTGTNTVTPSSGTQMASISIGPGTYMIFAWLTCFNGISFSASARPCEASLVNSTDSTYLAGSECAVDVAGSANGGLGEDCEMQTIVQLAASKTIVLRGIGFLTGLEAETTTHSFAKTNATNIVAIKLDNT